MSLPDSSVSVVIPTYNRSASLRRLLSALERCEQPAGGFEVIVVDDGSSDDTESVCRLSPVLSRYIRQPNAGAAAARNRGWRSARSDLIVFTDDDTLPTEKWLVEIIRPFVDTAVVGVGGRIVPMFRTGLADFVQVERLVDHGVDEIGTVRYLVTANAAFRRIALAKVGGFDEHFPGAAGEDVDLSRRVSAVGDLVLCDGAEVAHDHRVSLPELWSTYHRHGRARALLASKHPELSSRSAARSALGMSHWVGRFERYRAETGSYRMAAAYTILRTVCMTAFVMGVLRGRAPDVVHGDAVLLNDVGAIGGGQQVTLDVAEAMRALGMVPVIASPPGWLSDEAASRRITHIPFEFVQRRMLTRRLRLPRPAAFGQRMLDVVRVRRLVRSCGAHWLHTVASVPHIVGGLARVRAPWRLVWHINQVPPTVMALLPRPDVVLSPSLAAAAPLAWRRALRDRTHVCANGVDLRRFRPPSPNERTRARAAIGVDEELVVLTACRLEPAKGVHLLVEATSGIEDLVLFVAGGGFGASGAADYTDEVRRLAEVRGVDLRLLGPRADVEMLLFAADIAVLGSTWEAFGLFLAEAAACAVPTVGFDVGGVSEVVESGVTGLLAKAGDIEGLRLCLLELARSPDLRMRLGQGGRTRAANLFRSDAMLSAVREVYFADPEAAGDRPR